jgi:hypothetical protein
VARARLTSRAANASSTTSGDSYASDSDSGSVDDGTPPPPATSAAPSPAVRRSGSSSTSFLRGNIIASGSGGSGGREAAAAAALAARATDLGGAIFTWGGDFKWQQPWAKDTHQGCLGVGDLSGRLVPTLVKGEDNHVQVACGLNFTVALTNSGEVFQMGSTGATNNRERDKADWKVGGNTAHRRSADCASVCLTHAAVVDARTAAPPLLLSTP